VVIFKEFQNVLKATVIEIFNFIDSDKPVFCGVSFLKYIKFKFVVADFSMSDSIISSGLT